MSETEDKLAQELGFRIVDEVCETPWEGVSVPHRVRATPNEVKLWRKCLEGLGI